MAERIGALLTRLRRSRGLTQLDLAQRLCEAAGTATVTRHEVSRWERAERVPGGFWLGWLAVVLHVPRDQLEVAAGRRAAGGQVRRLRSGPADGSGPGQGRGQPEPAPRPDEFQRLWRPATPRELLTTLDSAGVDDLRELAHAWLTGPPAAGELAGAPILVRHLGEATARDILDALAARLGDLRRQDDQVGGLDHAGLVDRELRAALPLLRAIRPRHRVRRQALRLIAGYAQLAGWTQADAGSPTAARRAYRVALRAAALAGDRPLAGYVLGSLSHQSLTSGNPGEALELARTAYAGAAARGTALAEALLLHRVALAAARAGARRTAEAALARADRAADRADPATEPEWLYWLDPAELAAMTGRCWAALGRPLRAARLLARSRLAPARRTAGPRSGALYGALLAHSYLDLGEVEQAAQVARRALRQAVGAGSVRAATAVRILHPQLLRHRDLRIVQLYERRAADAFEWLPQEGQSGRASVRW